MSDASIVRMTESHDNLDLEISCLRENKQEHSSIIIIAQEDENISISEIPKNVVESARNNKNELDTIVSEINETFEDDVNAPLTSANIRLEDIHFKRPNASTSNIESASLNEAGSQMCRICHLEEIKQNLIVACHCKGTLKYVHDKCLHKWLTYNEGKLQQSCELCKFNFVLKKKLKPISKWKCMTINEKEKRKIFVDIFIYTLAIICNLWTIFSFADLILGRMRELKFDWVFFTVVILGLISHIGIICFSLAVFKIFFKLISEWLTFNTKVKVQPIKTIKADAKKNTC